MSSVSPELESVVSAVLRNAPEGSEPTLAQVRAALLAGITWSDEGELLYAQDTGSFVLELDDLIDRYGPDACAHQLVDQTLE